MKNLILSLFAFMAVQSASAQMQAGFSEVRPSWWTTRTYYAGQDLTYKFDQPTYVERVLFSAEGSRSFAAGYVYADGDFVSYMGVPGNDPEYPVIIRKKVSAIVVKFYGTITIRDMRMYVSQNDPNSFNTMDLGGLNSPGQLGKAVLNVIGNLQNTVTVSDFQRYLLPLRQSALVLAAKGMGRPLLSDNTQQQARVMIAQIKRAEAFLLGSLANSDYYTDQIQTLLFVKEKLESMYEL